jgi:glycosyltransferase involved in cell wall biosynthesis
MPRPIALDLTRMFIGLLRAVPRGIDRVEYAYAGEFLNNWPGECVVILPTLIGPRCFTRAQGLRFVGLAERLWRETGPSHEDDRQTRIDAWLRGEGPKPISPARRGGPFGGLGKALFALVGDVGLSVGRAPGKAVPEGAIYLNVGQSGLAVTPFLSWLGRRSDVKPVFMLHDVIPLEFPEYVPPFEVNQFRKIVANAAQHAVGLITTTEAAARSICAALKRAGRDAVADVAIPLPAPEGFLKADSEAVSLPAGAAPYFVCCGSIEPRKNHLLLLQVWRTLAARHGAATPKLILVGARWRASEALTAMLDRCEALADHVCEMPGLPTPALRRLLAGARASLMPSFAEGFGLPIVEALAVGTPVIASDLPAHREAGGRYATYIDPRDEAGWATAVERFAADGADEARAALGDYRPWRWDDYFSRLKPFLDTL